MLCAAATQVIISAVLYTRDHANTISKEATECILSRKPRTSLPEASDARPKGSTNQLCVMLPAHAEVWNGRFEHIGLRVPLEATSGVQ